MRIAILGAGLCGLATAWHLLKKNELLKIDIFDAKGIGGGASGIAAGLLHPYGGLHAKLNWMGYEGFKATSALVEEATQALKSPVVEKKGILRLALNPSQIRDFQNCAMQHPDVEWLDAETCHSLVQGIVKAPGIFIKDGITIHTKRYLEGLWALCASRGASLFQKEIDALDQFERYDAVIIALGAGIKKLFELSSLPLSFVKGQVLELEWPKSHPPLAVPLNSQAYLLMGETPSTCIAGASFERDYNSEAPDLLRAKAEIMPKINAFYPTLDGVKIISCQSGVRVSAPNHHPLIKQWKERFWIITGMGSKGLLYHSLMAEELASEITARLRTRPKSSTGTRKNKVSTSQ